MGGGYLGVSRPEESIPRKWRQECSPGEAILTPWANVRNRSIRRDGDWRRMKMRHALLRDGVTLTSTESTAYDG
jgi:hypothetical protein